jgi:hypothetical protein
MNDKNALPVDRKVIIVSFVETNINHCILPCQYFLEIKCCTYDSFCCNSTQMLLTDQVR